MNFDEFHERFGGEESSDVPVNVLGRVVSKRQASKHLVFYTLESDGHQLQLKCTENEKHAAIARGDWISASGHPGRTNTGQLSLIADQLNVEAPCLNNLPKPRSLKDPHTRRTQRHCDMIVTPDVTKVLKKRSLIIRQIRDFLHDREFLEVETPILSSKYGGASATPFVTTGEPPGYLRIAPELYLKQLIVGGMPAVFEIGKQFRNEGKDRTHVNEFTTLELYRANWDVNVLMGFTEDLLHHINPEWSGPFDRVEAVPALSKALDVELPADLSGHEQLLTELCEQHNLPLAKDPTVAHTFDRLLGHFVEPQLQQPTFLTGQPSFMCPLAKDAAPGVADRFELFIGGTELINAYSEINDPALQRERFAQQGQQVDEGYCHALAYGMPPTGGWGMGVDRLVQMLTKQESIEDVICFPREF